MLWHALIERRINHIMDAVYPLTSLMSESINTVRQEVLADVGGQRFFFN